MASKGHVRSDIVTFTGIRAWLPIIISILILSVGLVVGWSTTNFQVQQNMTDIDKIQVVADANMRTINEINIKRDQQYLEIQIMFTQIQKDIFYIRQQIDRP